MQTGKFNSLPRQIFEIFYWNGRPPQNFIPVTGLLNSKSVRMNVTGQIILIEMENSNVKGNNLIQKLTVIHDEHFPLRSVTVDPERELKP